MGCAAVYYTVGAGLLFAHGSSYGWRSDGAGFLQLGLVGLGVASLACWWWYLFRHARLRE